MAKKQAEDNAKWIRDKLVEKGIQVDMKLAEEIAQARIEMEGL